MSDRMCLTRCKWCAIVGYPVDNEVLGCASAKVGPSHMGAAEYKLLTVCGELVVMWTTARSVRWCRVSFFFAPWVRRTGVN